MKRNMRRNLEVALTLLGIVVIFGSVLVGTGIGVPLQFLLVLFGVMVMEIGVWGLSSRLLPSTRKFISLRTEGDNMIALIRELNSAAVAKDKGQEGEERFQTTLAEMHASVVRMSELASVENE